jgi:Predicted periplasmic protein
MKMRKGAMIASTLLTMTFASGAIHSASQAKLDVSLPQLDVAEYHKPYLAVWIEDSKRKATQVTVWNYVEMHEDKGKEWLKDLRQWWRRDGRSLDLPYDGLTRCNKRPRPLQS